MTWNFHQYYTNKTDGLIGKLRLSEKEVAKLVALRQKVRWRIRTVFEEAKKIAKLSSKQNLNQELILRELAQTELRHLSFDAQEEVARLIYQMDDEAREEFSQLSPRFWTQGSFKYDTLNRPFHPGQEMDIDDGTYMPMPIFESEPKVGHSLLILLVDSSLQSLEKENQGWVFEEKKTCGRIKIAGDKTHIDVPMYAIPRDQFLEKEKAMKLAANRHLFASVGTEDAMLESYEDSYEVDTEHVNLALRDGDRKWLNSDPKIVEDWFDQSRVRIGNHLPKICRFMKAWRDAQWQVSGPSSICLMAAIVNILDSNAHSKDDLDVTMKIVANNLHQEFSKGVDSPDHTDEKPLFPPMSQHNNREHDIMAKLEKLPNLLQRAADAVSKQHALDIINTAFGNRVTKEELIVSAPAARAFVDEPESSSTAAKISSTMVSG
jgi:hypothetical protein